ncbi:hypothetical protein N7449_006581 [Penicillium cf. viridicatum]|uniref:Yeast cell wall synthesis Kre9/Knh1-like N-terminal domain-containing protein n=1 Tax=Penicillium cf. viridicatum TaxID=2972119 RepID=A0A9W9MDB4_9EURO|nr:hypothetical protein N7449_006581 [Penicillium cf. viridicatum]
MLVNIISLVALATTVAGLTVTSPRIGEKIDPDLPLTIKWQAVTTDPETFSIELVNQNVYPPTTTIVADDIDASKGSYTVKAKTFTDVDNGKGYQINFLSPDSGILAQSQQFRVTEPGEIASSASASSSGKETSTALETSSLIPSTASTSDITSALSSSTASSYLSSTATHSSISVSTPTSYYSTASSSISTPTTSSFISSSANILIFDIHNFLHFYLAAYHSLFLLNIFYTYTFNFFFHYNFILDYIPLCYPDYFYFHYQVFHTSPHLDFPHIKHSFFYHIPFYPHFHYPCLDLSFNRFIDWPIHRNPFKHYFHHHSQDDFDHNLHCYRVG